MRTSVILLCACLSTLSAARLSQDDVLYLIVIDRFANGDKSNDSSLADINDPRAYHGGDFEGIRQQLSYLKDLGVTSLWLTPWYDNPAVRRVSSYGPNTSYHGYHVSDFYAVEEHFGTLESLKKLIASVHERGMKIVQDQVLNHVAPEHPWVSKPPAPNWINPRKEWFANEVPDLNQNQPELARYLIRNSEWWIEQTGVDAVRLDAVPYVQDSFWQEWLKAIRSRFPSLTVAAEVWRDDPRDLDKYQQLGFDLLFNFPVYNSIREAFKTADYRKLGSELRQDRINFFGSHDVARFRTETGSLEALHEAFTYILTIPGVPMIYYGDEAAMEGAGDPDNRRDFRPAKNATFDHVRNLLHLRAGTEALRNGKFVLLASARDHFIYARVGSTQTAVITLGKTPEAFPFRTGQVRIFDTARRK